MLFAKLEIWPFGRKRQKRSIATIKIANITPFKQTSGDYAIVLEEDTYVEPREHWAYVRNFHREEGAVALLNKALAKFV